MQPVQVAASATEKEWRAGIRHRVRTDVDLQADLELCDRWGIPHSQFLGGDGVWSDVDRVKALEFRKMHRETCGGCATRPEMWDPRVGGDRNARIADTFHCEGCDRIEMERQQVPPDALGIKVFLRPPTAEERGDG